MNCQHCKPYSLPADLDRDMAPLAEIEAENARLRSVICGVAHLAATLGSGHDGWRRGRFMTISNMLNASIGRTQSTHGDQFDDTGNIVRAGQLKSA
jgi:hypothetical protein